MNKTRHNHLHIVIPLYRGYELMPRLATSSETQEVFKWGVLPKQSHAVI